MLSDLRALGAVLVLVSAALVTSVPACAEPAASGAWPGMAVMKGGHRGYVDTPMGQVHYRKMGEGVPVLLLHQTPWFSVQYATTMPYLAAMGLQLVAPDRPGYGFSDTPDSPPSMEDYADNLVHVLDALGYESMVVVGHHTGTSVAAAFSHRHPERVNKLILHGTPLYTKDEQAQRLARPSDA